MSFSEEAAAMIEYRFTPQLLDLENRPDDILRRLFLLHATGGDGTGLEELWRRQVIPNESTLPALLRLLDLAAVAELFGRDAKEFAERAAQLDLETILQPIASEYNEVSAIQAAMCASAYLGDAERVSSLRKRLLAYPLEEGLDRSTFECLYLASEEQLAESSESLSLSAGRISFDMINAGGPDTPASILVAFAAHARRRGQMPQELLARIIDRLESIVFDSNGEPRLQFEASDHASADRGIEAALMVSGSGTLVPGAHSFAPFTTEFCTTAKRHRRRIAKRPAHVQMIVRTGDRVELAPDLIETLRARGNVAIEQANASYGLSLIRPPNVLLRKI